MNNLSIRSIAEHIFGPLVVARRLPLSHGAGRLFVSARVGGLKYLFKRSSQWDPELLRVASLLIRPGDNVWDVGANVGLFAMAASHHSGIEGSVLALEADLDAIQLLERTFGTQMKDHASVTAVTSAISSYVGFVQFQIAKRARAANSIAGFGSTQTGGILRTRTVPCISLDGLLDHFSAPQVLKIDVEGAELDVLMGAERILKDSRPHIYCEVAQVNRKAVTSLFAEHNYMIWDVTKFESVQSQRTRLCAKNTVAIAEEKVRELQ